MELRLSDTAKEDIRFFHKTGQKGILKKIERLLGEMKESPFKGSGKPEPLKFDLAGKWSRRINDEHRILYTVEKDFIQVHSLKGHY